MRPPEFWQNPHSLLAPALLPGAYMWRLVSAMRWRFVSPLRVGATVICVGNVTLGGAGKTPVVMDLAARLSQRGVTPHCLGRGYRGRLRGPLRVDLPRHQAEDVGDEALLLASLGPTWIGADRRASALVAIAAGADILILDDGYQDPGLKKDVSLLVIDGGFGFGNGYVAPAGPLREPVATAMRRADAVVILGADQKGIADSIEDHLPVLPAVFKPQDGDMNALSGQSILAFCGIGRPEKFRHSLLEQGCHIADFRVFADHHLYRRSEIEALLETARTLGVKAVTTEKDAVRLPEDLRRHIEVFGIKLVWREPDRLERLLDSMILGKR